MLARGREGQAREARRGRAFDRSSYQDRAVSDGSGEWVYAQDALLGLERSRSWRFAVKRSLYQDVANGRSRGRKVTGHEGSGIGNRADHRVLVS
jgi:hypothetical protein